MAIAILTLSMSFSHFQPLFLRHHYCNQHYYHSFCCRPKLLLSSTIAQKHHSAVRRVFDDLFIVEKEEEEEEEEGGGGGGGGGEEEEDEEVAEAIRTLADVGRSLESIPSDLATAIQGGSIDGSIVRRYLGIEKSFFLRWLMRFSGFKERLLADDLFLAKVAMECGIGILTKATAEFERRQQNFGKELGFVLADVIMALIADFMLVWLPAPTVSFRPPPPFSAGLIAKFFYGCPDNAFQVESAGRSYSLIQRIGAIMRSGAKLFIIGTAASLIGTGITNALIVAKEVLDRGGYGAAEADVPILETSIAYGVYMAVSSNLRYQLLAGVVEQRILEPMLRDKKLTLSLLCFAFRTGNTFLGSLMWVDYARLIGIQDFRQ